jgi:hypothetical protein
MLKLLKIACEKAGEQWHDWNKMSAMRANNNKKIKILELPDSRDVKRFGYFCFNRLLPILNFKMQRVSTLGGISKESEKTHQIKIHKPTK